MQALPFLLPSQIRKRVCVTFAGFAILLLAVWLLPSITSAALQDRAAPTSKSHKLNFVPGEILVRFRAGATAAAASSKPGTQVEMSLEAEGQHVEVRVERLNEGAEIVPGLRVAHVAPDKTLEAIEVLRKRADVIYAEPNYIRRKSSTPNDPHFSNMWNLKNTGQERGTPGADIKAELAWDTTTGSRDVVVAIIDEGIDVNHQDLQSNIWRNPGEIAGNGLDDDGNGFIDDLNGYDFVHNDGSVYDGPGFNPDGSPIDLHGTHVSGTIGAQGNNGIGAVGVNWQVGLMSLKCLGPDGGSSANVVRAYSYAKAMRDRWIASNGTQGANIRVTNNSYGGDGYSQAEVDAIHAMASSGILFVASAGNNGDDNGVITSFPATYDLPSVISVASLDDTGLLSSFSNRSPRAVHIGAPGKRILSTTPDNHYAFLDGTSMAAPHVSGTVALVLAVYPQISLTRLRAAILFGADSSAQLNPFIVGGSSLNAAGSLQNAAEVDTTAPAVISDIGVQAQEGRSVTLNWTAPGDDNSAGRAALYEIRFRDAATSYEVLLAATRPGVSGTFQSANLNIPFRHTSGAFIIRAIDNAGNSTDTAINVSVADPAIADPYINTTGAAEPLSSGGNALGLSSDDSVIAHSLPFNFPFYDRIYSSVLVSTNGVLYFSDTPYRDAANNVGALNGRSMIAGMWDDLDLRKCFRADSDVYKVVPANDRVIFRWQGVKYTSPGCPATPTDAFLINFEIELRTDGTIKTRYGQNTPIHPIVGLGGGEPESYLIASHTAQTAALDLTNAPALSFGLRRLPNVADLSISSFANFNMIPIGENVTINLTATNRGPARSPGVRVVNRLPFGSIPISCTTSQGTCTPNGATFEIDLGILESGGAVNIVIIVQPSTAALSFFANEATISGTLTDPQLFNNTSNTAVQVIRPNPDPQAGIVGIGASGNQSFAIRSDRHGLGWGANRYGQVGDGSIADKPLPVLIKNISSIIAIESGLYHTLALRQDGIVWSWGRNDTGQLGDGKNIDRKLPEKITGLTGVVKLSGGGAHSLALRADGTVCSWGHNANGQLGDGTSVDRSTPAPIPGLSGIVSIAAGPDYSLAVKSDGTVWAWGGNESGQLGDSTTVTRATPVQVIGLTGVVDVSAGKGYSFFGPNGLTNISFSVALKNDGTVWTWGHNWRGQLGDGTNHNRVTPGKVLGLTGITSIAAGGFHVIALTNDGNVWSWGGNFDGQLGDTTTTDRFAPIQVPWLNNIQSIAVGIQHSLALRQDGHVLAWGSYSNGQLGNGGTVGGRPYPFELSAQVPDPKPIGTVAPPIFNPDGGTFINPQNVTMSSATGSVRISSLLVGGSHNVVQLSTGQFFGWGSNYWAQLGSDPGYPMPDMRKSRFEIAAPFPALDNMAALSLGGSHNLLLRNDGSVWASGFNGSGQLGFDTNYAPRANFIQVPGLSGVTAVAAGSNSSMALKADGTVWAWGSGPINSHNDIRTPVQVNGLTNVSAIANGAAFFAIRIDGTLWAWGPNYDGILGDGTAVSRPLPVAVVGMTNVVAIASGYSHSVALKADGTVWAWGRNTSGELGLGGELFTHLTAVQVPGLSGVIAIASRGNHTLALKSDGTVWAWGENLLGQIGDGTTVHKISPTQVPGLTGVVAIRAGFQHSVALTQDGRLFTWGLNDYGQLGDGTFDNQASPIEMDQLTGGVHIHYTTNGSEPTEDDPWLTNASSLVLQQSTMLKAKAFKAGWLPSAVKTATYNISAQAPATASFTAASFSVNENQCAVSVNVSRSGDTSGAATVDYATGDSAGLNDCNLVNGAGSSRCDYATSIGTLRFAAAETSKAIFVPVVDDGYAEGNETFTITLNHPTGSTLGTTTTTTITILDNDSSNGANPLDDTDFFIRQNYIDFLGREPDPAGLAGWRNVLNNCGTTVAQPCDRIEVSAGFFRSEEFQSRGYFIYRFFSALGRIPLSHEFYPDFAKVSGFLTADQLEAAKAAYVSEVMARADFQTKYSSTFNNPTAYVEALLLTVGLPLHPSRAGWISTLNASNTTQTRGQVLRQLVESSEVFNKYYNEAFVIMQYFGYLRRTADASYLSWINTMTQTNGDYRIMINGFLNSSEYRRRFGP